SVSQQLRPALAALGNGAIDRVYFLAVTGDLAFQTPPLRVYVFQLAQQPLVYLAPGPFLAGSTTLDIVPLAAQGHQAGLGGSNQTLDLLDLPGVGARQISPTGLH